jgi:hypothetical protein
MTTTTRRAAIGVLAAVPLALPAVAAAAPEGMRRFFQPRALELGLKTLAQGAPTQDAELFRLIAAAREIRARYDAAFAAAEAAWNRTENGPPPQALIVTEDDARLWNVKAGEPFKEDHLNLMRQRQAHRRTAKYLKPFSTIIADAPYIATLSDEDRVLVEKMAAIEASEDRLIAAQDEWNELRRLARDRSGVTAAQERSDQLYEEMADASERVANTRALTLSGVLAKLALIAPDFTEESASELRAELGTSEQILFSVAVDYRSLAAV